MRIMNKFTIESDTTESPVIAYPLVICFAIAVICPSLTGIISILTSLAFQYGQRLLHILETVFTLMAYALQLSIVIGVPICMYHGASIFGIYLEANINPIFAGFYLACIRFVLVLGFSALMLLGLYVIEWSLWSFQLKSPMELAIVEISTRITAIMLYSFARDLAALNTYLARTFNDIKGHLVSKEESNKSNQLVEKEDAQTTPSSDELNGSNEESLSSSSSSSMIDAADLPDIDQWK